MEHESEYERKRRETMAANQRVLVEMGLADAVKECKSAPDRTERKRPRSLPRVKHEAVPTRRSTRNSGAVLPSLSKVVAANPLPETASGAPGVGGTYREAMRNASRKPRLSEEQAAKLEALDPSVELSEAEAAARDSLQEKLASGVAWGAEHRAKGRIAARPRRCYVVMISYARRARQPPRVY
jgi:hypothetical protein